MDVSPATHSDQVAIFHELRLQWRRQLAEGRFYAEGEQVLTRLLQSPLEILSMMITPEYFERWRELIASRKDTNTKIWIAEKKWMEEKTGQKLNQGCLALGRVPEESQLQTFLSSGPCCFVALAGLDHAVNVGAVVRNCVAFGVAAIFLDGTTTHPYSWRAVRTSLGAVFSLPVCVVGSLQQFLPGLKHHRIQLIAADPKGSRSIGQIDFSKHCCLLFGNEHGGISKELLSITQAQVAIPVSGNVDSLNVAAASAIFLHYVREAKSFLLQQSRKAP